MNDIFIGYSSEDRSRVNTLATRLAEHGWSVWWDPEIPTGKTFNDVIEEALEASTCVIIVWSKASVRSRWVKAEADEGLRRGSLFPVLIDDVRLPLAFRPFECANLVSWNGSVQNHGFHNLLSALSRVLGEPKEVSGTKPEPAGGGTEKGGWRAVPRWLPWLAATLAVVVVAVVWMGVTAGRAELEHYQPAPETARREEPAHESSYETGSSRASKETSEPAATAGTQALLLEAEVAGLISVLESRADLIRDRIPEEIADPEYAAEVLSLFNRYHELHIAALKEGHLILAHEVLQCINETLTIPGQAADVHTSPEEMFADLPQTRGGVYRPPSTADTEPYLSPLLRTYLVNSTTDSGRIDVMALTPANEIGNAGLVAFYRGVSRQRTGQ